MPIDPRPALAKRRLTDFFEGAGEDGKRETILALFRGRRITICLLWLFCQSIIVALILAIHPGTANSWLESLSGPAAMSLILLSCCAGVLWKDSMAIQRLDDDLPAAWARARDRSVSRLAVFAIALICGGGLALFVAATVPCQLLGPLG
jgi:hypothetical protein